MSAFVDKGHQQAPLAVVTAYSATVIADPLAEMAKIATEIVDDDALRHRFMPNAAARCNPPTVVTMANVALHRTRLLISGRLAVA